MSGIIKVNTSDLRAFANKLLGAGSEMDSVIRPLLGASRNISDPYNGQLSRQVEDLTSGVVGAHDSLQSKVADSSAELNSRAQAFDSANRPTSRFSVLSQIAGGVGSFLGIGSLIKKISTGIVKRIKRLAGFSEEESTEEFVFQNTKEYSETASQEALPEPRNVDENAYPSETEQCVYYARRKRNGDNVNIPPLGEDGVAADLININEDKLIQVTEEDTNLQFKIAKGYAILWGKSSKNPDGHIAIVEKVEKDYIVISHANWWVRNSDGKREMVPTMKISKKELESLYVLP